MKKPNLVRVARGPAEIHAAAPVALPQSLQALRGGLGGGAAGGGAGAVFQLVDLAGQAFTAKQSGPAAAIVDPQIGDRARDIAGVAECDQLAGFGVADFI